MNRQAASPPTEAEYDQAFEAYVQEVRNSGGSVFNVVKNPRTGLFTWAVRHPKGDFQEARNLLAACWDRTFRATEVAYAKHVLGVSDESAAEGDAAQ